MKKDIVTHSAMWRSWVRKCSKPWTLLTSIIFSRWRPSYSVRTLTLAKDFFKNKMNTKINTLNYQ